MDENLKSDSREVEKLEPTWMYETFLSKSLTKSQKAAKPIWSELWKSDCVKLEEALSSKSDEDIYVLGGTYAVNLERRIIRCLFWDEYPRERSIIRGTWFTKCKSGFYTPYSESEAAELENFYQNAFDALQYSEEVSVPISSNKVIMRRKPKSELTILSNGSYREKDGTLPQVHSMVEVPRGNVLENLTKLGQSKEVVRMRGEYVNEKEMEFGGSRLLPVDRVLFLVHGIGEALWSRDNVSMASLKDAAEGMENIFMKTRLEQAQHEASCIAMGNANAKKLPKEQATAMVEEAVSKAKPTGRTLVIPVYWHHQVQDKETELQQKLKQVTLKTVPMLREFTNDVCLDVLFYATTKYQVSILTEVSNSMNNSWKILQNWLPNIDDVKVGICGHSLGSVIGFDIMQTQGEEGMSVLGQQFVPFPVPRLDFKVQLYVGCGSPLGMFLCIRGIDKDMDFEFPTCKHYLNVFHPSDPISYRMEPRFDPRLADLEPAYVPHHGGFRAHVQFRMTSKNLIAGVGSMMKRFSNPLPEVPDASSKSVGCADTEQSVLTEEELEALAKTMKVNKYERVDYQLQESPMQAANQYIAALNSHSSYFFDRDFCMLISDYMSKETES